MASKDCINKSTKKCYKCLMPRPHSEFEIDPETKSGLASWCKSCEATFPRERKKVKGGGNNYSNINELTLEKNAEASNEFFYLRAREIESKMINTGKLCQSSYAERSNLFINVFLFESSNGKFDFIQEEYKKEYSSYLVREHKRLPEFIQSKY